MTSQPKAKLMARLRERRQREGWVRIEVWVPAALVSKVREYVRKVTASSASKRRTDREDA